MIRNYHLQKAVLDAYHPYLPKDRFPIIVLNIGMDAQLVDVNVHPSKWEIRLSKERQLEKLIYETLKEALKQKHEFVALESRKEKPKVEVQTLNLNQDTDRALVKLKREVNESFVVEAKSETKYEQVPVSSFVAESTLVRSVHKPLDNKEKQEQTIVAKPMPKNRNLSLCRQKKCRNSRQSAIRNRQQKKRNRRRIQTFLLKKRNIVQHRYRNSVFRS